MRVLISQRAAFLALAGLLLCSFPVVSRAEEHTNRDYEIAAAKGAFSLETNDTAAAAAFFRDALEAKPGDKNAAIGLGMALSRAGDLPGAKSALLKALVADPADARARYELGVVLYNMGEPEEATDFFAAVVEGKADDALRSAAQGYLDLLAGKGAAANKGFSLGLMAGLQYDSNVILEPDNPSAGQSQRKTDSRAVLALDANDRFLKSDTNAADAGYQFYQSAHAKLHEFNIQQHSLKLSGSHALSSASTIGLKYSFGYTLAGGSRFSTLHETIPYATVAFTPASLTEFHFICDKERFANSGLFPLNAEQSGTNRTLGALHTIKAGASSTLSFGYDYNAEEANERSWSYWGNKALIGFQGRKGPYTATLSASYYDRKYREDIGAGRPMRHDGVQEYSADLSRPLGKGLNLSLSDLFTVNDSNLPAYTYTRNIIGIFVVTRL